MKRKTNEEFVKEIYELVGDEYTPLEEYMTARQKILMRHNTCRYEWKVKPLHFISSGSRCPNCNKFKERSKERFLEELKVVGYGEYQLISDYTKSQEKVTLKHQCGYEWEIRPTFFLTRGYKCPKCFGCVRNRDSEYFKKEVYHLVRDEYEVLGEYINTSSPILIKHNKCSQKYEIAPSQFLKGRRCPHCNLSKGEETIKTYLNKNNMFFIKEYKFNDCKNKIPLRFDFAIFNNKNELDCLIEYDGSQHFSPKFGEDKYIYTIENDNIKNSYCKTNNIKLLRIPYWDLNRIEEILNNELK